MILVEERKTPQNVMVIAENQHGPEWTDAALHRWHFQRARVCTGFLLRVIALRASIWCNTAHRMLADATQVEFRFILIRGMSSNIQKRRHFGAEHHLIIASCNSSMDNKNYIWGTELPVDVSTPRATAAEISHADRQSEGWPVQCLSKMLSSSVLLQVGRNLKQNASEGDCVYATMSFRSINFHEIAFNETLSYFFSSIHYFLFYFNLLPQIIEIVWAQRDSMFTWTPSSTGVCVVVVAASKKSQYCVIWRLGITLHFIVSLNTDLFISLWIQMPW